ncbi:MAG: hypothetical protein ACRBCJ_00605 [Hyphomicrobiaceae bacterium]
MIEPYKGIGETVSGRRSFERLDIHERVVSTGPRTIPIDEIASLSVGVDDHWPTKMILLASGVLVGLGAFVYPLLAILSLVLIVSAVFVRSTQSLVIVTSDGTKTFFTSPHRDLLDEAHAYLSEKINAGDVVETESFDFAPLVKSQAVATEPPNDQPVENGGGVVASGFEPMTAPVAQAQRPMVNPARSEPPPITEHPPVVGPSAGAAPNAGPPPIQTPAQQQPPSMQFEMNQGGKSSALPATEPASVATPPPQPANRTPSGGGLLHTVTGPQPVDTRDEVPVSVKPTAVTGHHVDYSSVLIQVTDLNRFYAKTPDTKHIEERLSEMEVLMRSGTPNPEGQERIRVLCDELSTILQVYPTMVQLFDTIIGLTQQRAA